MSLAYVYMKRAECTEVLAYCLTNPPRAATRNRKQIARPRNSLKAIYISATKPAKDLSKTGMLAITQKPLVLRIILSRVASLELNKAILRALTITVSSNSATAGTVNAGTDTSESQVLIRLAFGLFSVRVVHAARSGPAAERRPATEVVGSLPAIRSYLDVVGIIHAGRVVEGIRGLEEDVVIVVVEGETRIETAAGVLNTGK